MASSFKYSPAAAFVVPERPLDCLVTIKLTVIPQMPPPSKGLLRPSTTSAAPTEAESSEAQENFTHDGSGATRRGHHLPSCQPRRGRRPPFAPATSSSG